MSNRSTDRSIHSVVAAILIDGDRMLFVHRTSDRDWAPGTWDLPGGHIEPDEDAIEAICREVHEELGIEIATPLARFAELRGSDWEVSFFRIDRWSGTISNAAPHEHSEIAWMTISEVRDLPMADPGILPVLQSALR